MIHNPSNLYMGNAVVLDSTPSVKFAAHLMAEQQAKNDALNKYNADQLAKINPEGMRSQEVPALLAAKEDAMNYYKVNSQAINHPTANNLVPYQTYQQKLNLANQIVNSGKAQGATQKEIAKVQGDPNKMDRIDPSVTMPAFDRQAAPTYIVKNGKVVPNDYDPQNNPTGHQDFDMDYHFNPKQMSATEMENMYNTYGKGVKPSVPNISYAPVLNPDGTKSKLSQLETTTLNYSPDQISQVGQTAKQAYKNSNSLSYTFNKNNPFDPTNPEHTQNFDQLNSIYKKYTGNDIKDQSDLYAASVMARKASESVVTPKVVKNADAVMAANKQNAIDKMNVNDQLIRSRMGLAQHYRQAFKDYSTAKNEGEGNNILNNFNNNTYNAGTTKLGDANLDHVTVGGTSYNGKVIQVPKSISDSYATFVGKPGSDPKDPSNWKQPDAFYMTDDKKNVIPLYFGANTATGGKYLLPQTKPIPIQNYNVELSKLLLTKSKTGNEVTNSAGDNSDAENEYGIPKFSSSSKQPSPPQATQRPQSKAVELKGNVDPKQLRVNQSYIVNGKNYIWNGKKLKAQ